MSNIKNIKYIGEEQTYDLEIDHKDHQFYLANGVLTSNSHACLYSMVSFHTAFLKAHFPIEFLLANLLDEVHSNAPTAASNIERIKNEIRAHKIKIVPPDINNSELRYTMRNKELITGLDALKYVSDEAIHDIISKRPFTSFQDFMSRVSSKFVRANTIQALAACGCLDSFKVPRHLMVLYCSDYRKKITVWAKKHDPKTEIFTYPWPEEKEWSKSEIYAQEQFYVGEGFACGTKEAYGTFFKDGEYINLNQIKKLENKTYVPSIKGVLRDLFLFRVKKANSKYVGQEMGKAIIEDINGNRCSLTIFPDRWTLLQNRVKELFGSKLKIEPGIAIHCSGSANDYADEMGIIMDKSYSIAPSPQRPANLMQKKINLRLIKKGNGGGENEGGASDIFNPTVEKKGYKTSAELFDDMQDWAFNEGLIELDDEESMDF